MAKLEPASRAKGPTYDPQGSGMDHDSLFRSLCPGVAGSGNLAHKWNVAGDHWAPQEPPANLRGD